MGIDNRVVGTAIIELRMRAEMTQQQLAAALNVSHQAVSKWENGAALPDIQTLLALTQLFGVTMEQLLTGDIPQDTEEPENEPAAEPETEPETEADEEAPSLSKWFRDTIPEETRKTIANAAKGAYEAASSIASKVGSVISDIAGGNTSTPDEAEPAETEEETAPETEDEAKDESSAEAEATISIDELLRLAPFMSREKLDEEALRIYDLTDWEALMRLAPFISRETVAKLGEKMATHPAERNVLLRLAPFMSSDDLYRLLVKNIDSIRVDDLRRFGPFLRRRRVDALYTYYATGKLPEDDGFEKTTQDIGNILQQTVNSVGNVVSSIGSSVIDAVGSFCNARQKSAEPSKAARVSPELKAKLARAALESNNWAWLNAHADELENGDLLLEICAKSVQPESLVNGLPAIQPSVIQKLDDERLMTFFSIILQSDNWELLTELHRYATQPVADQVVSHAVQADETAREEAYSVISVYAASISEELLGSLTEQAIAVNNWALIHALTEDF